MKAAKRHINRMIILMMAVILAAASVMPAFAEDVVPQTDPQPVPQEEIQPEPQTTEPQTTEEKLAAMDEHDRWVRVDGGLYYFNSRGSLVSNGWAKVRFSNSRTDLKWSYFNKAGLCRRSVSIKTRNRWVKADGRLFYFGKDRKPVGYGFQMIDDKLYFFGKDKALVRGRFRYKKEKYTTTRTGSITGLPYYRYKYRNGSFVYIDISDQRLYFCRNGKVRMKFPVVTGRSSQGWDTPTGEFSVRNKSRSTYLRGYNYETYVNYWMAFVGTEYGIHDATWRRSSDFRNKKTYKYRGSHGCVNMRLSDASRLYWSVSYGTPVIIEK